MKRTLSASIYQISGVNSKKKKQVLGTLGENIACAFLQNDEHEILCRNIRFERTEIDIISKHQKIIHFNEVKTLSNKDSGYPEDLITEAKISRMHRAAELWQNDQGNCMTIVFNLICIEISTINPVIHFHSSIF